MKGFKIEGGDSLLVSRAEQEIHPYSNQMHGIYLDLPYLRVLRDVVTYGQRVPNRTGIDTLCMPGMMARYDLRDRFPLLTTKKVFARAIFAELAWMIRGETNVKSLQAEGITIWDEWADPETGDLGPIYGAQWRSWGMSRGGQFKDPPLDQLAWAINRLKENPDCRRVIVTCWDPLAIPEMKLPPCHCFFQFRIVGGLLYTMLYQRSCDMFLGVPFNVASYAALTRLVADLVGAKPGFLIHYMGDAHVYVNHLEAVETQLARQARPSPRLLCSAREAWDLAKDLMGENPLEVSGFLDKARTGWFEVEGYTPHGALKADVAV